MSDIPHDFSRGIGTAPVQGHPTWKYTCGECGWSQIIATAASPAVRQCAYCGWEEITPVQEGTFAVLNCTLHGRVVCVVTNPQSDVDDYMDMFCPHCGPKPG